MHEYVWIPHIHSEVTENFSEYDLMDLPLIGKKRFSSSDPSNDVRIITVVCVNADNMHSIIFNVGCGGSTLRVDVDVMSNGLCCIDIESEGHLDDVIRNEISFAVSSMIASFIGGNSQGKEDDMVCVTIDLSGVFGPITAENEYDAVMQMFDSMIISCRTNVNDIMKSEDDYITIFGHIGSLIENVSNAELFVSSVRGIVPSEYGGMIGTLKLYRQYIDDRSRTIKIENDIRSEAGQRQLNRFTLSINRGMYYLSVLGIAVGMFGASIVADCIGFLGTTSKAIIISATSVLVLAVCWRICSRRSDDIDDALSPSFERSL